MVLRNYRCQLYHLFLRTLLYLASSLYLDKGLVTNYGEGATKCERGVREILPLRKGGVEKVLAILKGGGGHKQFWGSFYAVS